MQVYAWFISLFFMAVLIVIFTFIYFRSNQRMDYESIQKKGYRIRKYLFAILLFILLSATVTTLRHLPYDKPVYAAGEAVVIQVIATQFN